MIFVDGGGGALPSVPPLDPHISCKQSLNQSVQQIQHLVKLEIDMPIILMPVNYIYRCPNL